MIMSEGHGESAGLWDYDLRSEAGGAERRSN